MWIRAHYRSANQARWLRLRPLRIVTAHGFWYCEAFSLDHEEERTFRVDRFQEIERIEEAAELEAARLKRSRIKKTRDAGGDEIPIRARLTYRGALLAEKDEHIGDQVLQIGEEEWDCLSAQRMGVGGPLLLWAGSRWRGACAGRSPPGNP
ncbi:WYL domain-containing protein [Paenibacillus thiaminolyticus]|uniref:WYL domain-containing protein n=1 Tax=Paenibacillus thiaminolyticus TaxID=49283 RepID=UPI0037CACA59